MGPPGILHKIGTDGYEIIILKYGPNLMSPNISSSKVELLIWSNKSQRLLGKPG